MVVETVMRELSTVESSIVQSPDLPVVGAKIRCYAVQQDTTVREAFREHCQMLLALNLVQCWHDCFWEPGLSWLNVLKEESEGRGGGETGQNAYQDERHQPVVVVLVMSADLLATNPVAYVSLLQRQAFSMPSWMHVVLFLARPAVWDDASFTYDVVLPSTKAPLLLASMGLQEETLVDCARELKGWLETWLVAYYSAWGAAAFEKKHYHLALEAYSKARTLQPVQADLWERVGDAYTHLNQCTEALEAYTQARDRDCENTQRYRDVGDALYNLERHEEAVHAYTQGLALDKTDVTLYNSLCDVLMELERYEEALDACTHAIALKPDNVSSWTKKAELLNRCNRYEEVLSLLSGPQWCDTTEVSLLEEKATALRLLGRRQEALDLYNQLLAHEPEKSSLYAGKSRVFFGWGRDEEGRECLKLISALEDGDGCLSLIQGEILRQYDKGKEAQHFLDLAKAKGCCYTPLPQSVGRLALEEARYEEALAAFDQAIQCQPKKAEYYIDKGVALIYMRRYEDALAVFEQAVSPSMNARTNFRAFAHLCRGWLFQQLEKPEASLQAFCQGGLLLFEKKFEPKSVLLDRMTKKVPKAIYEVLSLTWDDFSIESSPS